MVFAIYPSADQSYSDLTRELQELGGVHNLDYRMDHTWDHTYFVEATDELYERWAEHNGITPASAQDHVEQVESDGEDDGPGTGADGTGPGDGGPVDPLSTSGSKDPSAATPAQAVPVAAFDGGTATPLTDETAADVARDGAEVVAQDSGTAQPDTKSSEDTATASGDDTGSADDSEPADGDAEATADESTGDTSSKRSAKKNSPRR